MSERVYCRGCGGVWDEDPFLAVPCAHCGAEIHMPCTTSPAAHRARKILAWSEECLCPCLQRAVGESLARQQRRAQKRPIQPQLELFG